MAQVENMQLDYLVQTIGECCQALIAGLQAGESQPPLGLRRAARLPVLAALHAALQHPILLLTDRADRALALSEELALWAPITLRMTFPEPAPLFYENAAWGENTRRQRLTVLTALASYHIPGAPRLPTPPVLIAPARALMTRTLPRRDFLKASRALRPGQILQPNELVRTCLALGYESVNTVVASGQFARRGGIIDLWPPAERQPVRLEFFGDEIETMRRFDPATQRTLKGDGGAQALITPAREYILGERAPALEEGQSYSEFWLPMLHPSPASLLDYLPRQALVLIDDRAALTDAIDEIEEQAVAMRQEAVREVALPEDFPLPYLTRPEIEDALSGRPTLELGLPSAAVIQAVTEADSPPQAPCLLAQRFTAGARFGGRLKDVMQHMTERCRAGAEQMIVSRQAARLRELWDEANLSPGPSAPVFFEGSLEEGWIFQAGDGREIHLLTDGEIFGWRRPEPRRRPLQPAEAPEAGYSDLQVGDWVVHVDHGVGRFAGLVNRAIENIEREYLCVEYADQAQLFVPVHQADRLTRYVGPDNRPPALSRLGSAEWRNVKTHVKEAVQEVAEDLLELYAQRSMVKGYAFSADAPWQSELEASFPYVETEDQVRVLAEVKRDMQSDQPMDRLICGDVGYGKTEVALRAAFKAVLDGKQVAMLVPTTVLAQQHYNTFQQRLAVFPVEVEMLSRFRTPQQQRDIVDRLAEGQVDIVIGTHRLISSDVQFKDLGLLIIDEEQRFGVTHKERLKKMRVEVDVLTLTATPIPRTLYMALSGVRDISTINTPPEERLPIITHVGPYSPRLARQAILREIERGGQIFFVHNRVQTIGAMRSHLERIAPEARIAVAHGQMPEAELSRRMEQFTAGEIDVLLSTSIIESGLDIPNANTLIVDRADTFGLAQLYQLRGRVGRGATRAYAYFFRHRRKPPSYEGRQRLETLAENTQLGAGFSIAMRDLEIRGAGDILGARQHGHIAAVGFHLYTSLLAEAVRRKRQEQGLPAAPMPPTLNLQLTPVNVELPLPISISADYVPDKNARLGLYRRMADMRSFAELDALVEEFQDRFGPPPDTALNLFLQLKIKLLAERAGLASVGVESGQISLRFASGDVPADLPPLNPRLRVGKTALWLPYKELPEWPEVLAEALRCIASERQVSGDR
ncbi:MAG: transcription-repair coupling factor [Anaerolineales bacterium]|nr:transcription-repair coupling factor [Anaerolineales bacterium]